MNLPFALPDWLPWWVPLVVLLPVLLYALAFLFMPFSVIGVKGRLEVMEARLDEIQNEIRHLSLRLPAAPRQGGFDQGGFDEGYVVQPTAPPRATEPVMMRPPIPPAPHDLAGGDHPDDRPAPSPHARPGRVRAEPVVPPPVRTGRAEPRLDWPR